jgi:Copper amine oxidase N-terminal domain
MRPYRQVALLMLCTLVSTVYAGAASDQGVPLATVAREAHLEYSWLSATRAVQLSGPGIVLVVRPGDNLYEVDDRVEVTAVTPRYISNDIYVSQKLATHIIQLARQAQQLVGAQEARVAAEVNAEQQQPSVELRGTIVLNVIQLKGAEALLVTGDAPPSAPVMITLLATLSSDLPNVLLSRHDLTAGPDGKFQAIVPIAPDYMRDSFIHVLATSVPGVTSASAQLLVHAPNPGANVPVDYFPGGIW